MCCHTSGFAADQRPFESSGSPASPHGPRSHGYWPDSSLHSDEKPTVHNFVTSDSSSQGPILQVLHHSTCLLPAFQFGCNQRGFGTSVYRDSRMIYSPITPGKVFGFLPAWLIHNDIKCGRWSRNTLTSVWSGACACTKIEGFLVTAHCLTWSFLFFFFRCVDAIIDSSLYSTGATSRLGD